MNQVTRKLHTFLVRPGFTSVLFQALFLQWFVGSIYLLLKKIIIYSRLIPIVWMT